MFVDLFYNYTLNEKIAASFNKTDKTPVQNNWLRFTRCNQESGRAGWAAASILLGKHHENYVR